MARLFDRLFPEDEAESKIAVHAFHAAIVDYMAGESTRNQIVGAWSMDGSTAADLDLLLAAVDGLSGLDEKLRFVAEMDAVNTLAEAGLKYVTQESYATRLGLV